MKTPLTIITGPLGSGKTTLLRHVLSAATKKIAILMNEFGDIAIDSKILEGKDVRIAELDGGCVCCSLAGEFEAAVTEIIEKVRPEILVLETTGVAEPDALVFNVQEVLDQVRLDGVVGVVDADGLAAYPRLGRTTRRQIEESDLLILNKADLVTGETLAQVKEALGAINPRAPIVPTERARVDPDLLFGMARGPILPPTGHGHEPEFESFGYASPATLERSRFEEFVGRLKGSVYRAKGFVRLSDGNYLFNLVSSRWELEPFARDETMLVFIGERGRMDRDRILSELKKCERKQRYAL